MEKWKSLVLSLSLLVTASYAQAGALVTNCENCSSYQYLKSAENVRNFNTVIVTDFEQGNISTYRVSTTLVDDHIEERRATLITTDSNVKSKFDAFVTKRNAFKSQLNQAKGSDGAHDINDIIGANTSVNAIDWLSDGMHAHSFYQNLKVQYPNLVDSVSFFESFKNAVSFSYGAGGFSASVNLAALNNKLVVKFNDGTRLILTFNHDTERMVITEAYDEKGRPIPTANFDDVPGHYTIPDREYYDQLMTYLDSRWNVEFQNWQSHWQPTTVTGQSCKSSCRLIATDRYECTYFCN